MDEKIKNEGPKVILTKGGDGRMKAIAEGRDGKLKTVDPTKENAESFLKIDTNGNALENFFKKFAEQLNNPSHTGIYAVSANAVDKMAGFLDKIITLNPDDKVLDPYRIDADGQSQEQAGEQKYRPLDLNKLDWKEVEKLGISGDDLRDTLKAMAWGHKSPGLIDIKPVIGGQEYPMQARLSLQQQPDGSITIQTHPRQEQPDFEKPFMGVVFTEADKENLQKTGHGGRVFDLELVPGGDKVPSLLSLDKMTNRVEAVPLSQINIPQTLKNAPLSPVQQYHLSEGRDVLVENMDKKVKPGEEPQKITRIVQYNAVNKNFDFRFTDEQREQFKQERAAHREQKPHGEHERKGQYVGEVWVPKVLLGVPLTDGQFKSIVEGKATWVEGMTPPQPKPQQGEKQVEATDAKGEKFKAWVKPSQAEGKLKFYQWNPDRSKKQGAEVTPANESKTQVAVNSHGKTNEATKHVKEPLKQGQQKPTEQQQRRFYKKPAGKSTGHKM